MFIQISLQSFTRMIATSRTEISETEIVVLKLHDNEALQTKASQWKLPCEWAGHGKDIRSYFREP